MNKIAIDLRVDKFGIFYAYWRGPRILYMTSGVEAQKVLENAKAWAIQEDRRDWRLYLILGKRALEECNTPVKAYWSLGNPRTVKHLGLWAPATYNKDKKVWERDVVPALHTNGQVVPYKYGNDPKNPFEKKFLWSRVIPYNQETYDALQGLRNEITAARNQLDGLWQRAPKKLLDMSLRDIVSASASKRKRKGKK